MSNPYPKLTVTIKTYDPSTFVSTLPPDTNLDNIIAQLESATVYVPTWPYPLKHGDSFTVYGKQAIYLYNLIPQLNENNNTSIEIDYFGDVIQTGVGSVVLINTDYVDYSPGDSGSEASNVTAYLTDLGRTFDTFTDVSAEALQTALAGKKMLIIPELEGDALNLTSDAQSVIESFVNQGNNLLVFYNNFYELNDIFGFSLTGGEGGSGIEKTPEAASTIFAGGADNLPNLSATSSIDISSLPSNSTVVYKDSVDQATYVTIIEYGQGKIFIFGWDWYNAQPVGAEDGGWLQLLEKVTEEGV